MRAVNGQSVLASCAFVCLKRSTIILGWSAVNIGPKAALLPAFLQHVADQFDVGERHFWVQGQDEVVIVDRLHPRKLVLRREDRIAVVAEVHLSGLDAPAAQLELALHPVFDRHGDQPDRVALARVEIVDDADMRQAAQPLHVAAIERAPERGDLVELLETSEADGRLDVSHVVFVADLGEVVSPDALLLADAIDPEPPQALRLFLERLIAEDDHPAIARRQLLDRLEAEGREIGAFADRLAVVACAERLGGVLDDGDRMLGGDRADRLHVARQPAIVDADDRLRPRRDFDLRSATEMLSVPGSMSTNLMSAPMYRSGMLVAAQVKTGVSTSSPRLIPASRKARCSASVPEPTATHGPSRPKRDLNAGSNCSTFGPCPIQRPSSVSDTYSFALRGTCG